MIYSFFSSNQNINIIQNIVNDDLQKEFRSNINQDHKNIILKNISFVKSKVSQTTPKGLSDQEYLVLMNQKVYDLSYPEIQHSMLNHQNNKTKNMNNNNSLNNKNTINNRNIVHNNKNTINNTSQDPTQILRPSNNQGAVLAETNRSTNNQFDREIIKSYEAPSVIDYPKPGNEQRIDVGNQFEKIQTEREAIYPKQKEIKFEDENNQDDGANTVDLYNDLLSTYNQQLMSMDDFEKQQSNQNKKIEHLEMQETLAHENNRTTPISQLFNQDQEEIITNTMNASIENIPSFNRNDVEIHKPNNEDIVLPPPQQDDGKDFSSVTHSLSNIMLKEPKFKLMEKAYNIVINSRFRNFEIYPNAHQFQFKFSPDSNNYLFKNYMGKNDTLIIREKNVVIGDNNENNIGEIYDNITSIELKSIIVPTFSFEYYFKTENDKIFNTLNIFRDNYLLLDIPEVRGPYQGGGNTLFRNCFAKLNLDDSIVQTTTFNQYFTSLIVEDQYFKYSPVTHGKLDKMTLNLNNKNGRLYNFGIDKLYLNNFSEGISHTNLCGSYNMTKFELILTNQEYTDYCNYYYNICTCQKINNVCSCECKLSLNPIEEGDLIYFYSKVPNNDQCVFFENIVSIDSLHYDKINQIITLKCNYTYTDDSSKKKKKPIITTKINFKNLFENFDIYSSKNMDYYILFMENNNSYYLKIKSINQWSLDLEYFEKFPFYNPSDYDNIKIGIAKPNGSGASNENKNSLFSIYGYNVYSSKFSQENNTTKIEIEIEYPYAQLPKFIQNNIFSNDDLFLIQDKHQITYTFQIKTHIKDYEQLDSALNESGNF